MKLISRNSGQEVTLWPTDEWREDIGKYHDSACQHSNLQPRLYQNQGGGSAVRNQCLDCGAAVGNALRKQDHPDTKTFDFALRDAGEQQRKTELDEIHYRHLALQEAGDGSFRKAYSDYLLSPVWKTKRVLVLKRANGICEGCGENKAAEVHHLTYEHFKEEFLFELVALCSPCHSRIHSDHSQEDSDDDDERICRACRFQGDGVTCPITNRSEVESLSLPELCGPDRNHFEPLK